MSRLTRTITPDEVTTYRINGVALLRGVLDLSTINELRRSIDEAVATLTASQAGYNVSLLTRAFLADDAKTLAAHDGGQHPVSQLAAYIKASGKQPILDPAAASGEGNFYLDTGLAARQRSFERFVKSAPGEIAGALLGSETVRFYDDQLFVKEPRTQECTAFHQDATYFDIDGDQCCVLWIPVDPVTAENGAMQYVRGSHLDGRLYRPNVFLSQTELPGAEGEPLPDIEGNRDQYDIVSFDVEPGDIVVHHYRTLHGAGGNASRYQVRRAVSLRYCGDDIRVVDRPWIPSRPHRKQKLTEGSPLVGPDFPIVWRRPICPAISATQISA
ncbi:MAG: phytanoyl-CoA dioxygenase family protein [Hyphomicrobiaceae bacterium]|nr:phytanoyl-CoA dioxygenase family protein [Hyphomicrobiaceae bacterium]